MNSSEIFDALEELAATSSKKDKEALVAKYGQDASFMNVVELALDPFTTYGMRNVPKRDPAINSTGRDFGKGTFVLLDDLAGRKLTGGNAREAVQGELDALNAKSAELLTRIIRSDLRAGFGASTVNKAFKGTIKTFPYMRCSLPKDTDLSKWDWERGIISQEKADGMFVNINHEPGLVMLTSRQGTPIPQEQMVELVDMMMAGLPENTQTHGELLVLNPAGEVCAREIGNGILNSIAQGGKLEAGHKVICRVWDNIPLSEVKPKGRYKVPYIERLAKLFRSIAAGGQRISLGLPVLAVIDTRVVHSLESAYAHYRELLQLGKEGTVIKEKTAIWGDYTSKSQIKLKLEVVVDLISTAINPGRVGTKNEGRAGAIAMRSACGKLEVDVAVKNEAMRDAIDQDPENFIERVYKVLTNAIMEPSSDNKLHSLFLPRLVEPCFRTDKDEGDDLQQIIKQFDDAISAV